MAKTKTTRAKRERSAPVATERGEDVDRETLVGEAYHTLNGAKTADDVRDIWKTYYLKIGHRLLGRLLLGQSVDQALRRGRNSDSE